MYCYGYNDYITNYLKELKAFNKVSIENLLSHTSGIINYYKILIKLNKTAFNITNNNVYELLKSENLLFNPGSHFDYSNSNYVLLAIIIEKVTGLSYKNFIEENIFKKIGMENSYVFDETKPVIKNRAYGYKKVNNKYYCDYQEALTVGDGGIFSTLNDLYIWDQILYTDRLVSKENLDLAFSTKYDLEEDYGFGWSLDESNKKIWHTGLDAGFRSMITRYLKEKLTVIILSNSSVCTYKERKRITDYLYNTYKN
ncbi:MAG: beta-lactamase family protein [Firmicutes bacterium]|nr:beta-lactamase family protein [Bacillota bacterium]